MNVGDAKASPTFLGDYKESVGMATEFAVMFQLGLGLVQLF